MGDYILYQMDHNAIGRCPGSGLNDKGEWVSYSLRLGDEDGCRFVYKNGIVPERGSSATVPVVRRRTKGWDLFSSQYNYTYNQRYDRDRK